MNLSYSLPALIAVLSSSKTAADHLYTPIDAVIGDFKSVSSSSPKVVFNYVSECAQISFDDLNPCIVDSFLHILLQSSTYVNVSSCQAPTTLIEDVEGILTLAGTHCAAQPDDYLNGAQKYLSLVSNSSCWETLCNDDILQSLESTWLNTCADVLLPYPLPPRNDLLYISNSSIKRNAILTCMLDYVMDTPASTFGLLNPPAGSPLECYPPAADSLGTDCPVIGQLSFDECSTKFDNGDDDDNTEPVIFMSYNYHVDDHKSEIISDFCGLLQDLSTKTARVCLLELCDLPTALPSATPSSAPIAPTTTAPIDAITQAPSQSHSTTPPVDPTGVTPPSSIPEPSLPSSAPSTDSQAPISSTPLVSSTPSPLVPTSSAPEISLTSAPTAIPSRSPTESPTRSPTSQPTRLPIRAPTAVPTRSPTKSPENAATQVPFITSIPSTILPSFTPTNFSTDSPSVVPSTSPTKPPTKRPTRVPSNVPTAETTPIPTLVPSSSPATDNKNYEVVAKSSAPVVFHATLIGALLSLMILV